MRGAILPGNATVAYVEKDLPNPGFGEVIIQTKSSGICGSDLKYIYNGHIGSGGARYENVIVGHEPAGVVVQCGSHMKRTSVNDRVCIYHISGCGICSECRKGYMISCKSHHRKAYGWQRDGGMAPYILAEEKDLIQLPDNISFNSGAVIACGGGTVFEAISRLGVSGFDSVFVCGLGPVGLITLILVKALGARFVFGYDKDSKRSEFAFDKGLIDLNLNDLNELKDHILDTTNGDLCNRSFDCSGTDQGRKLCLDMTGDWSRVSLIGELNSFTFYPSPDLLHKNSTIFGSWVTSTWRMEELAKKMNQYGFSFDSIITHIFKPSEIDLAYSTANQGSSGKIVVEFV